MGALFDGHVSFAAGTPLLHLWDNEERRKKKKKKEKKRNYHRKATQQQEEENNCWNQLVSVHCNEK